MPHLRQSTVGTIIVGPMMSNDTGTLALTNLTIVPTDVMLSKNGGAFSAKNHAGTGAHGTRGNYHIVVDATDTDTLGRWNYDVTNGTALPVWGVYEVIEASKYDGIYGTNSIPVGTAEVVLSAPQPTSGTIALVTDITTKTGYSLVADQSSVTIGTVNSSIAGNPTGGTVELAIQVNQGTVDAALNASNPTGGTVELAIQTNSVPSISSVGTVDLLIANGDKTGYGVSSGTVDRANSVPNPTEGTVGVVLTKTGYSLTADQSAVSFGTVGRANSVPSSNPSGGTVELAIQINSGTTDRTNSVPNPTGGTTDLVTNAGTLLQTLSRAEPSQGNPPATTDSFTKMDYEYKFSRNKKLHNGTNLFIYNDAGDTVDHKSTDSDASGTSITGELITGA